MMGNFLAFLLALALFYPSTEKHSQKEAGAQFIIPSLKAKEAEKTNYLQCSTLSGGCMRDGFLVCLTQRSDGE